MTILDWKYPDYHATRLRWAKCQAGVDLPEDVQRIGYCVVATRQTPEGVYVVAVRDGYYFLARQVNPKRFDGVHMVEIARTKMRYGGDNDEIVEPQGEPRQMTK